LIAAAEKKDTKVCAFQLGTWGVAESDPAPDGGRHEKARHFFMKQH